ncbi:MAG: hypothetical protein HY744_22675 [Deltaproteobacteria bacterium]|nr:hypothetical protein [Deltaproteobacteria bacterium]
MEIEHDASGADLAPEFLHELVVQAVAQPAHPAAWRLAEGGTALAASGGRDRVVATSRG